MKVLVVNYEFPPIGGGAGKASYYISRELTKSGVDLDILCSTGQKRSQFTLDHMDVYTVPTHRIGIHEAGIFGMVEFLIHASLQFRKLIATYQYDLVHYFFSVPTGILSFLQPHSVPYIISLRGGDVPGYNPGEMQRLHRLLLPLNNRIWRGAAEIVALSNDLGDAVTKINPNLRYNVIYNGIDTDLFYLKKRVAQPTKKIRLLCVSRLLKLKGIQYVIEAVHRLDDKNVTLTIVGTGKYEEALKKKMRLMDLQGSVTFLGFVDYDKLPDIYNASDIFVLPSFGDSFGQVYVEAMSCGLPVIAANTGGVTELIRDRVNGFLVAPNNVEDIVFYLRKLIADPQLRLQIGDNNASEARERFSWSTCARMYRDIYEKVLNEE